MFRTAEFLYVTAVLCGRLGACTDTAGVLQRASTRLSLKMRFRERVPAPPKTEPKNGRDVPRSPNSGAVTQPGPEPSPPYASPLGRTVVLIVDDDAGVREALHLLLDEEYAVMDAAHGRTALSMVRAERVDLVLLDILMPEIDGLEILQELKALEPDLPVIMMTGRSGSSALSSCKISRPSISGIRMSRRTRSTRSARTILSAVRPCAASITAYSSSRRR